MSQLLLARTWLSFIKTYPTNALVAQNQLGAPNIYCSSAKQYICTQTVTEAQFMCTASKLFQAQCVHHKSLVAKWMLQCQTQRQITADKLLTHLQLREIAKAKLIFPKPKTAYLINIVRYLRILQSYTNLTYDCLLQRSLTE